MAFHLHFWLPLALIGVEASLFSALAAQPCYFNSAELAETTGVDSGFLSANSFLDSNRGMSIALRETIPLLIGY